MALTRLLLPISILWFCFYSSHTILQDPLLICVNGDPGFDQRAYPSYFGHILDEFSSIMGFEPSILSLEGFNPVGSPETSSDTELSVDDFGARGDGTDDTKAFEKAWKEACSSGSVFIVPENKNYLLKQITFSGPCKSDLQVKIRGTIIASSDQSDWVGHNRKRWIEFEDINDLTVEGGGTINGNGETWWDSSCKRKKSLPCKSAPTALTFRSCKNLFVSDLSIKDSQKMHLSFDKCQDVVASNLMVTAPEHSPNTDGIHITGTQRIHVMNSVIGTGDDCISIESGSKMVTATNITCGPGHGISIGSLGDRNSEARVSGVLVDGGNLFDTTNGLRIKTWQGGSGSAKNIKFQNIVMHNVTNPIIIDQYYCDSKDPCPEQVILLPLLENPACPITWSRNGVIVFQESAVKISNVAYMNISGTSASEVAVKFDCSKSSPCQGILLKNINLVGNGGKETTMSCSNIVQGTTEGKVYPPPCL